ncbi:MAG: T9SS type A sorting domain-containing protein, partial [Bacteroidota bacterium]
MKLRNIILGICLALAVSQHATFAQNFSEVAGTLGIDLGAQKWGGHAWGDFNNDGCLDLLVNTRDATQDTRIFLSDCNSDPDLITFTDVTATHANGLFVRRLERSAIWGDFNNDGYLDFARNGNGQDGRKIEIWLNNGPTASPPYSFGDIGQVPNEIIDEVVSPGLNSEGMAWTDINGDGWLDLLYDNHEKGIEIFFKSGSGGSECLSTFGLTDGASIGLINNNGDGDYLAVGDLNRDGWPDIFGRKREAAEDLYISNGDGTYTLNTNVSELANNNNKGGVLMCDFDNDGDLDLFWGDAGRNVMYENLGGDPMTFTVHPEGATLGINPTSNIDGCACGDIDLDGDEDLFLAADNGTSFLYRNQLDAGNAFQFVQDNGGIDVNENGESVSMADYDNDGDLDIYINVNNDNNQLWKSDLINATTPAGSKNFLKVKILLQNSATVQSNPLGRSIIGAQALLRRTPEDGGASVSGLKELNGGRGHGSQDPAVLLYGLPNGPNIEYELQVWFPHMNGIRDSLTVRVRPSNLPNQTLIIGRGAANFGFTACNDNVSLPIQLLSFNGINRGEDIQLQWTTISEINNEKFVIERSKDGRNFEEIAQIDGAGNSQRLIEYTYHDTQPFIGVNYYRLKQIDFNGSFSYSAIIALDYASTEWTLLSNPTPGAFGLKGNIQEGVNYRVEVYNQQGKQVILTQVGSDDLWVEESEALPAGIYSVVVYVPTGKVVKKYPITILVSKKTLPNFKIW